MRFDVIERNPDYCFTGIGSNLERMLNAMMIGDSSDIENRFYQPLTEIRENDKEYLVKVQLPGVKKQDINIELDDDAITISAEHKFEEVKDNECVHSSQFCYGKFNKTLELGKKIDTENSECEYNDGILTIKLKKLTQKKEAKKLTIK